jgi:hypothetical protein
MSLAEHSSKVSHVDDSAQYVSTLMTLVELKIHLVSRMNFIQVDEWKRRILHLVRERKMKSRRFTSYEQVTHLRLRMLQNWFIWQPVWYQTNWRKSFTWWHRGVREPCCHKGSELRDEFRTKAAYRQMALPYMASSNRNHEESWRCISYFFGMAKRSCFC